MTTLSLAFTPCPNDTYMFAAAALGKLAAEGIDLEFALGDIERLNRAALAGRYDICKVSCALYGRIERDYALLDTGAALADGYGPLVLAREGLSAARIGLARVVAPGEHTTGAMLFRHWAPAGTALRFRPYDEIIAAVADGEFDAGVVIHEARFTFAERGLHCLVDLGAWWKATRDLAVPLGCYVMRRPLYARHGAAIEALMRDSLAHAERGDAEVDDYVRSHAQEMDDDVIRRHIALYVTPPTRALGHRGRRAIRALLDMDRTPA